MTWRNRIVAHDNVPPDQLLAHPKNYKIHPAAQQDGMSAVIGEVGFLDPVLVQQGTDVVVDGHMRVRLALRDNEPTIPVTYLDLSDEETDLVLATHDPLAAMAVTDEAQLAALLAEVRASDADTQRLLAGLAGDAVAIPADDAGQLPREDPRTVTCPSCGHAFTPGATP